jgi:hypothetical protein
MLDQNKFATDPETSTIVKVTGDFMKPGVWKVEEEFRFRYLNLWQDFVSNLL